MVPSPMSCAGSAFDGARARCPARGIWKSPVTSCISDSSSTCSRAGQRLPERRVARLQLPEADEEPDLVDHGCPGLDAASVPGGPACSQRVIRAGRRQDLPARRVSRRTPGGAKRQRSRPGDDGHAMPRRVRVSGDVARCGRWQAACRRRVGVVGRGRRAGQAEVLLRWFP